ncbi:MAG TPA: hypothetical protein VM782_03130 [Stellaceae bacterium]|nr:hypothetical protein [Stellaceae bacterium]
MAPVRKGCVSASPGKHKNVCAACADPALAAEVGLFVVLDVPVVAAVVPVFPPAPLAAAALEEFAPLPLGMEAVPVFTTAPIPAVEGL